MPLSKSTLLWVHLISLSVFVDATAVQSSGVEPTENANSSDVDLQRNCSLASSDAGWSSLDLQEFHLVGDVSN